jgi:hypothetical protein
VSFLFCFEFVSCFLLSSPLFMNLVISIQY